MLTLAAAEASALVDVAPVAVLLLRPRATQSLVRATHAMTQSSTRVTHGAGQVGADGGVRDIGGGTLAWRMGPVVVLRLELRVGVLTDAENDGTHGFEPPCG
jgi:hypothetical protein